VTSPQLAPSSSPSLRYSTSLFSAINTEWTALTVDPATCREVRLWAGRHLAWSTARTVSDIEALAVRDSDATLSLLLIESAAGSALAGTALVRLMLPKLIRIHRYARLDGTDHSRDERASRTIAAFYEVIASHRVGSTGVAGALSLRTLGLITKAHESTAETPSDPDRLHQIVSVPEERTTDNPHETSAYELHAVLAWAVQSKTITTDEHSLLIRAYLVAEGADLTALADDERCSPAALRQRLSRAVARVRDGVAARTGTTPTVGKRTFSYSKPSRHCSLAS
jgi:lambda repressor-like predicted transcriptional regulator